MGLEIERKYLVTDEVISVISEIKGIEIKQGYVALGKDGGMTVRLRQADEIGYLTLKGASEGISCGEWEYQVPLKHVHEILDNHQVGGLIEKTRYKVPLEVIGSEGIQRTLIVEVDVFKGKLNGLIVAEIELDDENQELELPKWIGKEVSYDMRYKNSNLANMSFPFE